MTHEYFFKFLCIGFMLTGLISPAIAEDVLRPCSDNAPNYLTEKHSVIADLLGNKAYDDFIKTTLEYGRDLIRANYENQPHDSNMAETKEPITADAVYQSVLEPARTACTQTLRARILELYDKHFTLDELREIKTASESDEHDSKDTLHIILDTSSVLSSPELVKKYDAFKSNHEAILSSMSDETYRYFRNAACAKIRQMEGPKNVLHALTPYAFDFHQKTVTTYYPCKLP